MTPPASTTELDLTKAQERLRELVGRVAHEGEIIVITENGEPVAKLVPVERAPTGHLADVKGWLADDDPFFELMERFLSRSPRVLKTPGERYPSRADLHERGRSR